MLKNDRKHLNNVQIILFTRGAYHNIAIQRIQCVLNN